MVGAPPDWQSQGQLKEGAGGSLGFLKAVPLCGSVQKGQGRAYSGGDGSAGSQPDCVQGRGPSAPLLSSPR